MRRIPVLVSLAALAACSQQPPANEAAATDTVATNTVVANEAAPAPQPTDAQGYMIAAAASDLFAIRSSTLAAERSQNDAVKAYAKTVIADRTDSAKRLAAAAREAGLTPPEPALTADQQADLDALSALQGHDFDAEYARQQLSALQRALLLTSNYANEGDTPALQEAARATQGWVQRHLAVLRGMTGLSS
ncbi:MAG TPA: DUF4142 domain-containing protein [Sphingomonas sp.]|nr:DUF4142 domain-containing protein [Sphingomonas sp.]